MTTDMAIPGMFFFLIVVVSYFFMLARWTSLWILYPQTNIALHSSKSVKISVIVAVRNEADNIESLLNNLTNQDYEKSELEIIISDDQSEDDTVKRIIEFTNQQKNGSQKIRFITTNPDQSSGKKAALQRAIHISSGELILTTDADCRMSSHWVSSFAEVYKQTKAQMITGFVKITPAKNLFEKLQAFEFLSLSGSGAVSVINQKPLMCNGANLAFTREVFDKAGGYSYGNDNPSGDDTFLMLKISGENKQSVVFNKCAESIVSTFAASDLSELLSQRIRWASKVKNYKEGYIKRTGLFVFLVNSMLLLSLFFSGLGWFQWSLTCVLWLIKSLADFLFLANISSFANQRRLLLLFLPATLLYPFYSLAGMLPAFINTGYNWKGRKLK